MRFAKLAPATGLIQQMEALYGTFDIGLDGTPNVLWQARNLKAWKLPDMLQLAFFPEVWIARVRVNRRIAGPLERVYLEIVQRWTPEARQAHGLNQFVKCYCFGDGAGPNLFWWGAAWELSAQLGGEPLAEVIKIFTRNGFTHAYTADKRKVRVLEYW